MLRFLDLTQNLEAISTALVNVIIGSKLFQFLKTGLRYFWRDPIDDIGYAFLRGDFRLC